MANVEKTLKNLAKNRFKPYFVQTKEDALNLVKTFLRDGEKISKGGSATLIEVGIQAYIESGLFDYEAPVVTKTPEEEANSIIAKFTCDTFFTSSNAVTEDGKLYNVDGRSSRVAPLVFGPSQVIVVVGINKIVENVHEADKRVKTIAAPLNAKRLSVDTPCTVDGICHDCHSSQRICCNTVVTSFSRSPERIKVVIVNENLGF